MKKVSPAIFAASALCFLLPFVTFFAAGNPVATFSGARVASGITVSVPQAPEAELEKKFEADPMAVFALLCILLSLVMSFVANGRLAIFPALGGAIGTGAMFAMRASFANQVAKQTNGALQVNYQPGFLVASLLLAAAAVWQLYLFLRPQAKPEEYLLNGPLYPAPARVSDVTVDDIPPAVVEEPLAAPVAEPVQPPVEVAPEPVRQPVGVIPPAAPLKERVLCSRCGTELEPQLRFCTSCGTPVKSDFVMVPGPVLPAGQIAALPVKETVPCAYCGNELERRLSFCTACGKPVSKSASVVAPPAVAPMVLASIPQFEPPSPVSARTLPAVVPAAQEEETVLCTQCGTKLPAGSKFCNLCGKAVGIIEPASPTVIPAPVAVLEPPVVAPAPSVIEFPKPAPKEDYAIVTDRPGVEPATASATVIPPLVVDSPHSRKSPLGALLGVLLVIVLLVGGGAGWYFWGVDTVIVCTPFDSQVFLDDVELTPESPGRFTVDHLARRPHMLKVRREGYGESFLNLDFPVTSVSEWINVRLTPLSSEKKSH